MIQSVDFFRVLAIVFVIAIHAPPFDSPSTPLGNHLDAGTLIYILARFAVPFFFVMSGYFWAEKIDREKDITKTTLNTISRALVMLLAWSVIYLLPTNLDLWREFGMETPIKGILFNLEKAASAPITTLMQGTKIHLWFLVSLIMSVAISGLLLKLEMKHSLLVLAFAVFLTGLACGSYRNTPFGLSTNINFSFRNGPFFSLIFFVTGQLIHGMKKHGAALLTYGIIIAAVGLSLHILEVKYLKDSWSKNMLHDYVFGTYFLGTGVALIALSNAEWLRFKKLASLGPIVPGIYASHYIFIDTLKPLKQIQPGNGLLDFTYIAMVFLMSWGLSKALASNRFTRRFVT